MTLAELGPQNPALEARILAPIERLFNLSLTKALRKPFPKGYRPSRQRPCPSPGKAAPESQAGRTGPRTRERTCVRPGK